MKALMRKKFILMLLLSLGVFASCEDNGWEDAADTLQKNPILLAGDIEQLAVSRVNDNGFCDGDVMGVYIVDYEGNQPGTLQNTGNRGNNIRHTFDETANKWNSAYDVYWKDKTTHIDVYGYYPFSSPGDVNAYEFEVEKDQSKEADAEGLGGLKPVTFCGERRRISLLRKESSDCL